MRTAWSIVVAVACTRPDPAPSIGETAAADDSSAAWADTAPLEAHDGLGDIAGPDPAAPLVIIGGGVSGMAAAIAAGHGILIEAEDTLGGRARFVTGLSTCVGCLDLVELGYDDSVALALSEWVALTGAEATDMTAAFLADSAAVHAAWAALGVEMSPWFRTTTLGTPRLMQLGGEEGALAATLAASLPDEVEVWLSTRVEGVAMQGGQLLGVRVDGRLVPASAVVIASGGFTGNADLMAEIVGAPDGLWGQSPVPGAAGDAVQWANGHAWGVSDLDAVGWYYSTIAAPDGDHHPIGLAFDPDGVHPWIWVDGDSGRFADETIVWSLVASTEQHRSDDIWAIGPEEAVEARISVEERDLFTALVAEGERATCASEVNALASALGLDEVALQAAVAQAEAARTGVAGDPWGRDEATFPDLSAGPFCAWRPGRVALKSFGGVSVDDQGRVLDREGEVVPGVYAVGEAAGMGAPGMGGRYGFDGSLPSVFWSGARVGASLAR